MIKGSAIEKPPEGQHPVTDDSTYRDSKQCNRDHAESYGLKNILLTPQIQSLMDDFYELTKIGMAILDLNGEVLVATGWQDICTRFHRKHPRTRENCIASDLYLTKNVVEGQFLEYKCKNNMWDVVTPIFIGKMHVGNLFFGQFFYEDEVPDRTLFASQAERYGFDEKEYLAALDRVPRWSRDKVDTIMRFYVKLTSLISLLSYSNMRLMNENAERQRTEEVLLEKDHFMKQILTTNPNSTFIYDVLEERVVFVNPKSIEMFGFTSEEIVEHPNLMETIVHPDDHERALEVGLRVMNSKDHEIHEAEVRIRRGEDWAWFHLFEVPFLRNENGQVVQILATAQDVTDRKRMEDELRRTNEKLDLLNSITRHDINNQLMVIRGNVDLIKRQVSDPSILPRLNRIEISIENIGEQIEFTKDYQKAGTTAPEWQRIREFILDPLQYMELESLDMSYRAQLLEVYADSMLSKVFHNLIENSIKYGGKNVSARIDCQDEGDGLLLIYEDNGVGVPNEEKDKIFEKGFGKGTGLGMFLSREILAITEITISETGVPGKGARFEMSVPRGKFRAVTHDSSNG